MGRVRCHGAYDSTSSPPARLHDLADAVHGCHRCQMRAKKKGKMTFTGTSNASSGGLQRTGSEISDSELLRSSLPLPHTTCKAFAVQLPLQLLLRRPHMSTAYLHCCQACADVEVCIMCYGLLYIYVLGKHSAIACGGQESAPPCVPRASTSPDVQLNALFHGSLQNITQAIKHQIFPAV